MAELIPASGRLGGNPSTHQPGVVLGWSNFRKLSMTGKMHNFPLLRSSVLYDRLMIDKWRLLIVEVKAAFLRNSTIDNHQSQFDSANLFLGATGQEG